MEQGDSVAVEERQLTSISKASTYEEIGEFWDTHSITDYEDQIYEVDFKVRKPVRHTIVLKREEYERAKSAAERQGVAIEVVVKGWFEERLGQIGMPKESARVDRVICEDELDAD